MGWISFMRHGTTNDNVRKHLLGCADPPLTIDGISQTKKMIDVLKRYPNQDFILSSPKLRARQTASIISAELSMNFSIDERLIERDLGKYDGLSVDDLQTIRKNNANSYVDITQDWGNTSGVEQDLTIYTRVHKIIAEKDPSKNILLITHAGVIKSFFHTIFSINEKRTGVLKIRNSGVMVFYRNFHSFSFESLINPR